MRALIRLFLILTLAAGCGGGADPKKKTNVEDLDLDGDGDNNGDQDTDEETPGAPKAPTGLAATPAVQGATLTWNAADTATRYILLRSTTAGSGYAQVYAGANKTYFDGALAAGTTYYYVVQAENDAGKSPHSSEASAKALYPVAPAPATVAVVQDDGELRVYWSASAGAVNYYLQRQTEGGAYVNVATGATLTNYVDTSVVNGYRYGYRIQVANPDGALTSSTTATERPFQAGRQYCVPSQDGIHLFSAEADVAATPVRTIAAARMFTNPTDMAVDPARNRLYVLDTLAGRVVIYDTSTFAVNPVTSPALGTIPVLGATAVTVDTSAGELYVAETGAIRVYDSSGALVRSVTDLKLLGVVGIAWGAGEVFTAHTGSLNRWAATTLAHVATITDSGIAVPVAVEYVGFNDRLVVVNSTGGVRMYNRNSSGIQTTVAANATGFSDVRDIAYDSTSKQMLVLRSPGGIHNTYAYDVTGLSEQRHFKTADVAPLSAIEVDAGNNRYYAISGDNVIGQYNGLSAFGPYPYDQKSADKRIVNSINGMTNPANFTLDVATQELLVRNTRGFVTVHSLAEGASNQLIRYARETPRGFYGDIAVYPAANRFFGRVLTYVAWFTYPFSATQVTSGAVQESLAGSYNNLSLSADNSRLYAFDADATPGIHALYASGDIDNRSIYNVPATTSAGTNVAYANFPGGGEVIAIDPENKFGWVLTPSLTVKRTFTLSGATSTWVSLVADPVNQEVYVLRDGVVDVYNRNDLKGNGVAPVRSVTLIATGGVNTAKDIELCK